MKSIKLSMSTMLIALCVSFVSCRDKEKLANNELVDKGIFDSWTKTSLNAAAITVKTVVLNEKGISFWQEESLKGEVVVRTIKYTYDENAKKGKFLFENSEMELFFKYENDMLLFYTNEVNYTYFKRSDIKLEPIKLTASDLLGKWRHDNFDFYAIYEFNADGSYVVESSSKKWFGSYIYDDKKLELILDDELMERSFFTTVDGIIKLRLPIYHGVELCDFYKVK